MDIHGNFLLNLRLTLILLSLFPANDCRMLDGYAFPVYTTEFCPRNETEWNERSSVLNCTGEDSTYACFPNDDITELIEFCYPLENIRIPAGYCLLLSPRRSKTEAYDCTKQFDYGCPKIRYSGSTIFKYPSCVSIGNGCFLAEPFCESSSKSIIQETTTQNTKLHGRISSSLTQHMEYSVISMRITTLIVFLACLAFIFDFL